MTKLEIILESDPRIFQDTFNSKMEELKDCNPTYEFVHSNGFCAYITYKPDTRITTETGKNYNNGIDSQSNCRGCAFSEPPPSDRVKWCKCKIIGANVNQDREPCSHYYPEVANEH